MRVWAGRPHDSARVGPTLRISCEPVPPSVLPRGHEAALQSVRTGAAERFVCFIRLFDSLVTLLQSRRSRHGEATRPCPFRSAVFVRCRFPLRSPLQRRKARANPAFVPRIAQPLGYVGRVATALGPLATTPRSCLPWLVVRYLALSVSFGNRLLARIPSGRGPIGLNYFL